MADLEYMLNYAKENQVKAILHSGDFFDKPEQPGTVMTPLIKLLKQYNIPIFTTIGQHDTNGHNSDDYPIKSIGQLDAYGLVKVLIHGEEVHLEDYYEIKIAGYGFNDPETDDLLSGRFDNPAHTEWPGNDECSEENGLCTIALVHASIGADETMFHRGISNQNIKGAHLSLLGDIHPGFEPHEFANGNVALGLGSIGRRNITDFGRKPQFAIIEIDTNGDFDIECIPLPCLPDASIFHPITVVEEVCEDTAAVFKQEWAKAAAVQDQTPADRARRLGALMIQASEIGQPALDLVLIHMPVAD